MLMHGRTAPHLFLVDSSTIYTCTYLTNICISIHQFQLPPEVLSLILHSLHSPTDLSSLMSASRPCAHIVCQNMASYFTSVLHNAIHPDAMRHALAVLYASPTYTPFQWDLTVPMEQLLSEYLDGKDERFPFPTDWKGISALWDIYDAVSCFVTAYAYKALKFLDPGKAGPASPDLSGASLELSRAELARLQRAFFRYELYCCVFPTMKREFDAGEYFSAQSQWDKFLSHLAPWEVEEMSCAYFSYFSLAAGLFDKVARTFVKDVMACPGVVTSQVPLPSEQQGQGQQGQDGAMVGFDNLEERGMGVFSSRERGHLNRRIGFVASLGAQNLSALVQDEKPLPEDKMIRFFVRPLGDFFPDAVDIAMRPLPQPPYNYTVLPPDIYRADPQLPGPGYYMYKHSRIEMCPSANPGDHYSPLRERGYVFWDGDRLLGQPRLSHGLLEARYLDQDLLRMYDPQERLPAEALLRPVRVPRVQMKKLMDVYAVSPLGILQGLRAARDG